MRILGFGKMWPKLQKEVFTTFRFKRRDADWQVGEEVQIVYRPRSKERKVLGTAIIMGREVRRMSREGSKAEAPWVTNNEAHRDGFEPEKFKSPRFVMWEWLFETYGGRRLLDEPMNKLTLKRVR